MEAVNSSVRAMRAALLVGVSMLAVPAAAQTGAAADERDGGLQEIVVTAQRREENLQRVPVAVTAFTPENIRVQRIQNSRDLNSLAPGLTVGASPGGSQSAAFTLRGVFSTPAYAGQNGGVSVYIDGVYLGSNTGQFFDIADIERIEVLRGPQGTLFGRNSTGGAISITSRQPKGEFAVHSENTYGNYDQFRSKTRVDLPAWGPLSASLTYLHNERRGDIRNIGAGTQWDYGPASGGNYGIRTASKYLGDHNTDSVTAQLLLDPGNGIRVNYKFDYTDEHYTDNGQGLVAFGFGGVGASAFTIGVAQVLYASQPAAQRTPFSLTRPSAVNNSFTTGGHLRNYGHTLTANWEASDSITLKNIAAYRNTHLVETAGVDGFGFAGLVTPPASTLGVPVPANVSIGDLLGGTDTLATLIGVSTNSKQHQFSDEFTVNYTSDLIDVTAGGLHYEEKSASIPFLNNDPFRTGVLSGLFYAAPPVAGQPIVLLNGRVPNDYLALLGFGPNAGLSQAYQPTSVKSRSNALFAQVSVHATDQITLIAGARNTWDYKHGIDALSSNGTPVLTENLRYRKSRATWLLGVNYQATPDVLAYAKAGTGFISGGQLGGVTFDQETAESYEVGLKADLFDRRARFNVALYHVTYGSLQFPTTITAPSGNGTLNAILNYGDARANGVELEGTFIPVRGLTLSGNLGYTDFKLKNIDPRAAAGLSTQIYSVLPNGRPKWTAVATAQYETPEMGWGGHVLIRGEANYKGSYFNSPRGYDDNGDGKFNSSDQSWDFLRHPSQWILNGRIAVTDIPVGPAKAELAVWGRNLTNNKDLQFVSWLSFGYSGSYERARTYGLDLTIDF